MIRIYGHSWATRWGAPAEEKTIKVHSNCEEAELFLNGRSLGTKKRNSQDFPAAGLRWVTPFEAGKNSIKVVGKKGKETIEDYIEFDYETRSFGKPSKIVANIVEDTDGYAWIEAELRDENYVPCLTSDDYIRFDAIGDGELIVDMGTSSASSKVQAYNGRAKIQLIKRGTKSIVSVKSNELETVYLEIK